jgi:hypothetical protein
MNIFIEFILQNLKMESQRYITHPKIYLLEHPIYFLIAINKKWINIYMPECGLLVAHINRFSAQFFCLYDLYRSLDKFNNDTMP